MKPAVEKAGYAEGLVTEAEKPEDYQKVVDDSAYPPAASPRNLTLEQLEAIAKLRPKTNNAGMQVHPAVVPLFRSMSLNYSGGTYQKVPIRFRLHTPEPFPTGKKYPLVVWLHGAGECGTDNINQLPISTISFRIWSGRRNGTSSCLCRSAPHTHVAWEAPEICSTRILPDGSIECKSSMIRSARQRPAGLHDCHDRGGDERVSRRSEPRRPWPA